MDPKKVSRTEYIEQKFDDLNLIFRSYQISFRSVPFYFWNGNEIIYFQKYILFTFHYFFFGTKIKLNVSKKKYFIFVPERE